MPRHRRRSPGKPRVSSTVLDRINPNVAGIDCGAAEHFAAVPPDRDGTPVQSFRTYTGDLVRLAEWLTACRVQSVAMEATGVYARNALRALPIEGGEPLESDSLRRGDARRDDRPGLGGTGGYDAGGDSRWPGRVE